MHKTNTKIAVTIISFSIIITGLFLLFILNFQNETTKELSKVNGNIFHIKESQIDNLAENGKLEISRPIKIESLSTYNVNLLNISFKLLIPIILKFCIAVIILSILLIMLIQKFQKDKNRKIANNLINIKNNNEIKINDKELAVIYNKLENKFKENLDDYKRLNSYLSHEQKNVINILKTQLEIDNNQKYIDDLNNITNGIDDIIALSENEKDYSVVDVLLICAKACDNYKKIQKNIYFEFEEGKNYEINGKEKWIYRLIANLLDNAIKYGRKKDIFITLKEKNNSVILKVEDNGIGISKEKQDLIFNNYYRINKLNKDGYGIGLSLVKHVCNLCEGYLYLESKINKGTTIIVSFPIKN